MASSATPFPFPHRAPTRISFFFGFGFLAVFGLLPAILVLVASFTDLRGLPQIPVHWIGLENYRSFLSAAHWGDNVNALKNTVIFAGASTIVQLGLALAISVVLDRPLRGRAFYRAVVFMPTVLGVTVIGLIWSLMFNPSAGPAAEVLSWFGTDSAFFGDPHLALALVTFVQIWAVTGVSVIIFLAGLQAIPVELYEAASIDGASGWKRFRLVTIPLLAPSITANVLLGVVNAMQSYQLTYILTGPSNRATQVLSLMVYVQGFGATSGTTLSQSQGYAAAISMVQFVIVGAIVLVTLWFLRKREARL